MILFFSGTGNSLQVAERLASLLDERLLNMECGEIPQLKDDEPLGIVFPVYAWGLPRLVKSFLKNINVGERYVWCVMTCGDDMGYADKVLQKALSRKVDAAFSVQMPNTYVCLPGFDVDSDELAASKRNSTMDRLAGIAEVIGNRSVCRELTRGGMAWCKTYLLRPLFNAFLVTDKYFKTSDACSQCGLCAKSCPMHDIVLQDGRVVWKHQDCTGCLRCYHKCPKRAVDWGKYTRGKGQKR